MTYIVAFFVVGFAAVYALRLVKSLRTGITFHAFAGGEVSRTLRPAAYWTITTFNAVCVVGCGWVLTHLGLNVR